MPGGIALSTFSRLLLWPIRSGLAVAAISIGPFLGEQGSLLRLASWVRTYTGFSVRVRTHFAL